MSKKYFLIIIISFLLMVFEFLLSKELLFLRGMSAFRIVIPLVLIGYSAGSALSKINLFKTYFNTKILIAISSTIIVSSIILVRILVLKRFFILSGHFLVLIWPFIFFGIYFGKVYSEAEDLRKVFLANGFGLMLGAIFSGKVFRFMGWEGGLLFICSLLLLFALFFEEGLKKLTLSILFVTVLAFHFNLFKEVDIPNAGFKFFASGGKIVRSENTELIRTDLVKIKDRYKIFTDGGAPTSVHYNPTRIFNTEINREVVPAIPYIFRNYEKALIIGTGGGIDLVAALEAGVSNIVGIELNPVTIRLMKNEFKKYSGEIYFHPTIKIINEEGRSYVQNTKDSYDLVFLRGTDTITTSSFVSSTTLESYLYTKEAIKRYWEILSDRGILFICRSSRMYSHPRSRLVSLLQILKIYRAIEENNFSNDIRKNIIVTKTEMKEGKQVFYSILLSKTEFTKSEDDKLSSTSHQILHFPGIKEEIDFIWLKNSKHFNVTATSDIKPPYNNYNYWQTGVRYLLRMVIPLLFFTFMVSLFRKDIGIRKGVLFVLLGIGYIAIQISITERMLLFLRNPAYSMQVALSSFLLFGGLGGYFGASLKKGKISLYSLILFLMTISYIGIFNLVYKYQLPNSQAGKIIFSFLIIAPIGFLTAVPFSVALSREKKKHIMYAIDASGTAAGTLLIFFIHEYFGFNMGFAWAALIYLIVSLLSKG